MGTLEEKEQGQEEQAKFRCEMSAMRCPGNIQVEAPSWSENSGDIEIRQVSVRPWGSLGLGGLVWVRAEIRLS